jgi:ribosomal protein L11 methyltransferase
MIRTGLTPERLYVYECHGPRSPLSEPADDGFLGIWPESPFFYLFFEREALSAVNRWIANEEGWTLRDSYEIDYDQWQQLATSDHEVGPFVIRTGTGAGQLAISPWKPLAAAHSVQSGWTDENNGKYSIILNPGLVFGSGLHPTTRGCLLAVSRIFETLSPKSVVDLGTGTGILAVACGLLGACRVRALDCIPLAIRVARENVRANGLEDVVDLLVARELRVFNKPCDLLLMNIEWPFLQQALRAGDWMEYRIVVLSGFLESQWERLKALLPSDCRILFREVIEEWVTAVVSMPE